VEGAARIFLKNISVSGSSSTFCPIDDTIVSGALRALLLIT